MEITKEKLEERKAGLLADLHAISGAIQDVDYWLEQLSISELEIVEVIDVPVDK
jgi:hypothetical protein